MKRIDMRTGSGERGTDRVALQTIWSTEISDLSDGPHIEQVQPYDPCPEANRLTPQMLFNYSNAGESSHRHGLN
jgi:hypothetical protein